MKTNEEKLKNINKQIEVLEKALKDGGQKEAIEWGKKYITKLYKKRDKLIKAT